jgi:nicotinate dehydrogenase subunit B
MKASKIDSFYFHDVNTPPTQVNRREFLKNLGGGVIIVFSLSQLAFRTGYSSLDQDDFPQFNAFLRVKEDGRIECYSGKIEMGQGINTSLAQVLAEELEVDISHVEMIMGDTNLCPHDDGTWGSMTTRFHDPLIRAAAAEAREVLKKLASEKLEVPADQLKAADGKIVHRSDSSKSISYAELTKGQKIIQSVSVKPELKKPEEFKIIGNSYFRRDSVEKVTGNALIQCRYQVARIIICFSSAPPCPWSKTFKSRHICCGEN